MKHWTSNTLHSMTLSFQSLCPSHATKMSAVNEVPPSINEFPFHLYFSYGFLHDISCFFLLNLDVFPQKGFPLSRTQQNISPLMNSSPHWIWPPQDQFPSDETMFTYFPFQWIWLPCPLLLANSDHYILSCLSCFRSNHKNIQTLREWKLDMSSYAKTHDMFS